MVCHSCVLLTALFCILHNHMVLSITRLTMTNRKRHLGPQLFTMFISTIFYGNCTVVCHSSVTSSFLVVFGYLTLCPGGLWRQRRIVLKGEKKKSGSWNTSIIRTSRITIKMRLVLVQKETQTQAFTKQHVNGYAIAYHKQSKLSYEVSYFVHNAVSSFFLFC